LFDVVIHCAGKLSGTIEQLEDSNINLTMSIVSSVPKGSHVHLIFLSTGAVYGNTIGRSSTEIDEVKPLDVYGQTKLSAEREVSKLHRSTILRLPSVYGRRNQKGLVYHIIKSVRNGTNFSLENGGNSRRTFLSIIDLVSVVNEVIKTEIFGTYNVSEPKDYSVIEIITELNLGFKNVQSENNLTSMVLNSDRLSGLICINYSNVIEFIKNVEEDGMALR
jgi:nucleoside-diphosphate-sugar epimerase